MEKPIRKNGCDLVNPVHLVVVAERDNSGWRRPQNSWPGKVSESCWNALGMERGPAGRLAQGSGDAGLVRQCTPWHYALSDWNN